MLRLDATAFNDENIITKMVFIDRAIRIRRSDAINAGISLPKYLNATGGGGGEIAGENGGGESLKICDKWLLPSGRTALLSVYSQCQDCEPCSFHRCKSIHD